MAADFLISAEVLGGCLLVVIAVLVLMVLRRRAIARGQTVTLMAMARGDGWKLGIARFSVASVQWFPIVGVGLRPRVEWTRGELVLEVPTSLEGRIRPLAILDPVGVICHSAGHDFRIALAEGDYTALRSWSESAPPGLNANVA
ncbi:DUF2550 family protein [Leekyejoonella antrihumi]|uniref:DUF2550 family protein n=1 Tax=Leekyejoonella antrihumi TaxID=1660198 RepID=A0A563E1V0_9MICO|nr:DUF2550 family protein [Leekyejoonella antrihumi]TWP36518.1 DUF2550 family protein [Leekyejoonella antrihumi]